MKTLTRLAAAWLTGSTLLGGCTDMTTPSGSLVTPDGGGATSGTGGAPSAPTLHKRTRPGVGYATWNPPPARAASGVRPSMPTCMSAVPGIVAGAPSGEPSAATSCTCTPR